MRNIHQYRGVCSPLRLFDRQPAAGDLPNRFPNPFSARPPHPLALRASQLLEQELRAGKGEWCARLRRAGEGKMFGVLVVQQADGSVGYLQGFSGALAGSWNVDGFVPPLFDQCERDAFWLAGQDQLAALDRQAQALAAGVAWQQCAGELCRRAQQAEREREQLLREHARRRLSRRSEREALRADPRLGGVELARALHRLDQQSRADKAEKRRFTAQQGDLLAGLEAQMNELEQQHCDLIARRADLSNQLLSKIFATYRLVNASGGSAGLAEIYAPARPPGGAGDCAAPKLLGYANRHGLRPIALTEFWWGAPPVSGGRHSGSHYPACRRKCGPLVPWLLTGLETAPSPQFAGQIFPTHEPSILVEDECLAVVCKPSGMLSVPGRGPGRRDSVLSRMGLRWPEYRGPKIVQRLDLDTSGLMVVAKTEDCYRALQRQFASRAVEKRYVAWLDGVPAGERGAVELPLRPDLDDRPRQMVDRVHGKPALTLWRVLQRRGRFTLVEFCPLTGRTHQLRVHAAHPQGLAAPIVGDRLYGRRDPATWPEVAGLPLMLHAEILGFTHPGTGQQVRYTAPFRRYATRFRRLPLASENLRQSV